MSVNNIVCSHFTVYCQFYLCVHPSVSQIAEKLLTLLYARFKVPITLYTWLGGNIIQSSTSQQLY